MSRRFQELRKECRVKKTELAQKVGVDVRTITNWEKVNGTIPPLDVMDRIASALQISLFEIYSRFMYNPDKLENDVVQNSFFNNTDQPLARPVPWDSDALNLFIRIFQLSLNGLGSISYQHCTFRFSHIVSSLFDSDCSDDELRSFFLQTTLGTQLDKTEKDLSFYLLLERGKSFRGVLSDGCIMIDGHLNTIVLNLEMIKKWRLIAQSYGSIVFEIELKKAIFLEMDKEIHDKQVSLITLTLYDYGNEHPPKLSEPITQLYSLEKSEVFGRYLKEYRKRHELDQQQLAEQLSMYLPEFDNKKISKWGNGELPSAYKFHLLCNLLNLSEEKLLDAFYYGYYDSTYLDTSDQIYTIGLSLSFIKANDFSTLSEFLQDYSWSKSVVGNVFENNDILGAITFNCIVPSLKTDDFVISRMSLKDDAIIFYNKNNSRLSLRPPLIKAIRPFSTHSNYCYEFKCTLLIDYTAYDCCMRFSYFMKQML